MSTWPLTTHGSPQKPACVLLHGWLGSGKDWDTVMVSLAQSFFCVAVDLPGHGSHPLPEDSSSITFPNLADDLHRSLLPILGERPFALVGYSMGGRLALRYALQYPQSLTALVLENCQPGLTDKTARMERKLLDVKRAETILSQGLSRFLESWYSASLFQSLRKDQARFQNLLHQRMSNKAKSVARMLRDLSPGTQEPVWSHLPQLQTRTMLLTGRLDPKYPSLLAKVHEQLPQSTLCEIEDAGHNVHWEAPEAWLNHVTSFLLEHQVS